MAISAKQQRELINKARAANRRLERASEAQRSALEYYLRGYNTREGARGIVFKQSKARTEREYKTRMEELRRFMEGQTSTRRGWESLKQANIEKGSETLRGKGYNITDQELAQVIKETGGKKKAGKAFYTALNNITAAKKKKSKEDGFTGLTPEEITEAINSRRSEMQATLAAIKNDSN